MKKILAIILAAVMAAPMLQSCNKSDDQPDKQALVSIVPYWSPAGFACQLDNGETIYPGNMRCTYTVNQESIQRAIVYFKELSTPVTGFTYNADIFNVIDVTTKDIETLTNAANDTLTGSLKINDAVIGGGYLNVDFNVSISPYTSNQVLTISLVDNLINGEPEWTDYYPLELKFKSSVEIDPKQGQEVNSLACFHLGALDPDKLKCKGYLVTYKDYAGETRSITVNYNKK